MERISRALFILIASLAMGIKANAQTKTPHYLMASMGDSITAGFLAATNLSWFNSAASTLETDGEEILSDIEQMSGKDKASQLFSWGGTLAHTLESRTTLSWATGKKISSQYVLLHKSLTQNNNTIKLAALNVALSGGVTGDLFNQVDTIVSAMATHKYDALKYVTLLIGNNDACHNMNQSEMKSNLHEVFRRLSQIQQSEPIRVLVSGIPRIPDTGSAQINQSTTVFGFTCQSLRESLKTACPSLTSWQTPDQYNAVIQYIQQINELLSGAVDDANQNFKNLNVVFSNALFEQKIDNTDLAIDCFHPNSGTQNRIAAELWKDQPWY